MSDEKRPEWMSSISGIVNPDDYLLGRKIDKTFELYQEEKAQRAKKEREDLIAADKLKLVGDPILELERRKQQLKYELISNPIKLRQFRERLLREGRAEKDETSSQSSHQRNSHSSSSRSHTSGSSKSRHSLRERTSSSRRSSSISKRRSSPRRYSSSKRSPSPNKSSSSRRY